MKPEELSDQLKEALGTNLKSVAIYGSAASGMKTKKYSDVNTLVVVENLALGTLRRAAPIVAKWTKKGNPPPLFFTEKRIHEAEDVFPIEFLDIKERHIILFGDDPFANLSVPTTNLRHQIEFELRGKLIQLRERYLLTQGKASAVRDLLAESVSTFNTLFRATVRMVDGAVPPGRTEGWAALKKHVNVDEKALQLIYDIRDGKKDALNADPDEILERYLGSIENLVDFVDGYK